MLKFIIISCLLPLGAMVNNQSVQNEKVFQIRESHQKLQGLEVELEDGQVISLTEFLENISETNNPDENKIMGGEVPWPKPKGKKGDK